MKKEPKSRLMTKLILKLKSRKGFTLIELLAVIVILAVLIMLALPNVLRIMENARKNSFKVEVQEILTYAETAYSDKVLTGGVTTGKTKDGTQYRYVCMNLQDLYSGGYSRKDFDKAGYSGFVEIFVPAGGQATYGISISNGVYAVEGVTSTKMAGGDSDDNVKNQDLISQNCTGAISGTTLNPRISKANYDDPTYGKNAK